MKNYDNLFICSTDTVVGLGAKISEKNLSDIYKIKQRQIDKKIMIVVGSIAQAQSFKQWNEKAEIYAQKYWPGSYSIVVNNQGFRMPNNKELIDFILAEGPFYLTSANISGQPPIDIKDANKFFPQIKRVYNFGNGSKKPSTIIDVESGRILR